MKCFFKVNDFKKIVPSIASQKQLDRKYHALSGYSIYQEVSASNKKL